MYIHFLDEASRLIYAKLLVEFFGEEIEDLENLEIIDGKTEVDDEQRISHQSLLIDSSYRQEIESINRNISDSSSSEEEVFILNEDVEITSSAEEDSNESKITSSASFSYLFVVGKIIDNNYHQILDLAKKYKLIGLYLEFDNYYLMRDEILECFERVYFKQMTDYNIIRYKINACYYNYLPDVLVNYSSKINPRTEINFKDKNLIFILSKENIDKGKEVFQNLSLKHNLRVLDDSSIHKFNYHLNNITSADLLITDNYVAIWLAIISNTPFFVIDKDREVSLLLAEIGISKFLFADIKEFSLKYFGKLGLIRDKVSEFLASSLTLVNVFRESNFFTDGFALKNKSRNISNKFYIEAKNELNLSKNLRQIYKLLFRQSNPTGLYFDFDLKHSFDDHPILHPWTGIIHSIEDFDYLLTVINFRSSLFICRGLFSFNYKVKIYIDSRLENINCTILETPIYNSENLVKYHLKAQKIKILKSTEGDLFSRMNLNRVILLEDHNLEIINQAIIMNIPLLVENNLYNQQLLGKDYPLFYSNLNALPELNLFILKKAIDCYSRVEMKKFSFEYFLKSLNNNILAD